METNERSDKVIAGPQNSPSNMLVLCLQRYRSTILKDHENKKQPSNVARCIKKPKYFARLLRASEWTHMNIVAWQQKYLIIPGNLGILRRQSWPLTDDFARLRTAGL